jgi:hypothetical protein
LTEDAALATPAAEPARPAAVDLNRALDVISNLPRLIREATPIERKQVLNLVFDRVWVGRKTIAAITPHQVYLTLLTAMRAANCVIGVADGLPVPVTEDWRALPIVVGHKQAYTFVRP